MCYFLTFYTRNITHITFEALLGNINFDTLCQKNTVSVGSKHKFLYISTFNTIGYNVVKF